MSQPQPVSRDTALAVLRRHGIRGPQVYLIDLIPLIEMIWADGRAQESERAALDDYLVRHVEMLNELAGYSILTLPQAREFVAGFLRERPDPDLLRTLRSLISAVRLSSSDEKHNEILRNSLLAACLEIGTSAVTCPPEGPCAAFDPAEKRSFFEILETIEGEDDD